MSLSAPTSWQPQGRAPLLKKADRETAELRQNGEAEELRGRGEEEEGGVIIHLKSPWAARYPSMQSSRLRIHDDTTALMNKHRRVFGSTANVCVGVTDVMWKLFWPQLLMKS